jgi:hypothetical protein
MVTVNAIAISDNQVYPHARIGGFFFHDPTAGGTFTGGDVYADISIAEDFGLVAVGRTFRCHDAPNCSQTDNGQYYVLGPVNIGEPHTLRIEFNALNNFVFTLDNNPPTLAYNGIPSGLLTYQWKGIGTHIGNRQPVPLGPGQGGYVDAIFDSVLINDASTPISDANGMINRTYWDDSTLEFVREQITDGVYGMALRSYGSFANNGLNLVNGQNFNELQADLTVDQFINTPSPNLAYPMAALWGSFYNDGSGGIPGIDSTGDIRALAGIRIGITTGQPVGFYTIVRCTQPDCNLYTDQTHGEFQRLYFYEDPLTIGQDLVGKPHRVSIRYNNISNTFIFGFDGRLTTPGPSDWLLPLPPNPGLSPKVVSKGALTRVASGPSGEGYVSAQFANIATVVDTDGDGMPDSADNCPAVYNPIVAEWADINGVKYQNSQPDSDHDGYGDACDLCPRVANNGGPCGDETGTGVASTTGPLITATFTYNGSPTFLVSPNCNNVVFSSVPEIPQNCRFREPYVLKIVEGANTPGFGKPGGDWIAAKAGDSWTINCNPLEIFDEDAFKAENSVTITPMYTLFFEDPGIDPETGTCAPGEICVDATQYHLFQGTMVANDVMLTKDQTKNFKTVSIDIRPLSQRNIINLQSCGYIPVAIFSSPDFDARTIDIGTVKMGDAGVKTVVVLKKKVFLEANLDVNRDGLKDKLVFFNIKDLNLAKYTGQVCLTGKTTGGSSFIGCDSVTIVSQKSWNLLCGCEDED